MHRLASTDNPAVQLLLRLHDRRGRQETGLALLEGVHLLAEALRARARVAQVYFLADWAATPEGKRLLALAEAHGAALCEVSARIMGKAATTDTPPPVLATVNLAEPRDRSAIREVGVVLDGLQDPGNLGTILRTAWGAGVDCVWTTPGTVDVFSPKVLRAAQGAHFHLFLREADLDEIVVMTKGEWRLVAAETGAAVPFWSAEFRLPCLVCFGNEAHGISAALRQAAVERVSIPLVRGVDSLNVGVSAAIMLFELVRRRAGISL